MSMGFDRPLYLLPFDHRESFKNRMFGWQGALTDDQTAQIAAAKQDEKRVGEWLATASQVPGFVGFAVGRTVFWEALMDFRTKKITRDVAVANIARRYMEFVDIFQLGKIRAA